MRLAARPLAKAAFFVVLACAPLLIHIALSASGLVSLGLVAASATVHALIYAALLAIFGSTLLPRRDALITALARKMYGAIPDEMAVYTRGVTWAWCGFFVAQLGTSLALFLWAPVAAWSIFVNVLNLPLLALMFAAEHAVRMVHLHNPPRHTVADVIRMIGYIKQGVSDRARSG